LQILLIIQEATDEFATRTKTIITVFRWDRLHRVIMFTMAIFSLSMWFHCLFSHSHSFYCIRKSIQYNNTNRRYTDTTGTSKSSQSSSKACP